MATNQFTSPPSPDPTNDDQLTSQTQFEGSESVQSPKQSSAIAETLENESNNHEAEDRLRRRLGYELPNYSLL